MRVSAIGAQQLGDAPAFAPPKAPPPRRNPLALLLPAWPIDVPAWNSKGDKRPAP